MKKFTLHPGYRWVVVGCCFVMILVCLGFCSSTKGLYLSAVTEALQLERSLYSVNDTLRYIASAIMNLLFGMLVLRFGPRKLVAGGFACLCGAMLCYTFAQNLVLIYLGGILLGVGQSWSSTTLVGFVIGRWCPQNKGTIMGAVLAANGVGSAAAAQIVGPMINGSLFGFRNAYGFTALLMVAVGIVVVTLFRDQPAQTVVAAAPQKKRRGVRWDGIDLKRALKTPYFYIVCFYVFVMGLVIQKKQTEKQRGGYGKGQDKNAGCRAAFALKQKQCQQKGQDHQKSHGCTDGLGSGLKRGSSDHSAEDEG